MNVPLAMAAEATGCLSAIPKAVSENYLLKAKEVGAIEAAKVAEADFTKPDPKRLAEVETLRPLALAEAEKAAGINPTLEQLQLSGAAGQ